MCKLSWAEDVQEVISIIAVRYNSDDWNDLGLKSPKGTSQQGTKLSWLIFQKSFRLPCRGGIQSQYMVKSLSVEAAYSRVEVMCGVFAVNHTRVWPLISTGVKIEAENSFVLFHSVSWSKLALRIVIFPWGKLPLCALLSVLLLMW